MSKNDKYYFKQPKNYSFAYSQPHELIRWNPEYVVEVDEEIEAYQYISLSMNKLGLKAAEKPTTSEFDLVKPIIREVFIEHYSFAVKYIHNAEMDEGECYLYKRSKDWIIIRYFSKDEKKKFRIDIDLRDGIEYFSLYTRTERGHKGRRDTRNHGEPITMETFLRFFHVTTQFLSDSDSLQIFRDDYIKNMKELANGKDVQVDFVLTKEKYFSEILEQLAMRRNVLEKRLIENDSDSITERAQLRGELKGLDYAVTTVKRYS